MEGILTTAQQERARGEVLLHARGDASAEAVAHVLNKLESLATSAGLWNLWRSGEIEIAWDESRQEIVWHSVDLDDEDDDPFDLADQIGYSAPAE